LSNVTFAPRTRLGNYELLLELASGGAATVGIAVQRAAAGFERLVVVKRVHRHLMSNTDFLDMLRDEARMTAGIRHPNVVGCIDVVQAEGELALIMDYVESVPLSLLLARAIKERGALAPEIASRILSDILAGLHEAHEAVDIRRNKLGIVHRDVSPQNVIVGVDGMSRVIDFGIAKAESRLTQTKSGFVKGKFAYMSPEQVEAMPVDRRSDVFSAGIVLHEALTGKRLFSGGDEFDIMRRVLRGEIPDASSLVPVSPTADAVLRLALARNRDERFSSARAFQEALEQAIPPAPHRAVADVVVRLCGAELEERHSRLQAVLGEELAHLSPRAQEKTMKLAVLAGPPPSSQQNTLPLVALPPAGPRMQAPPLGPTLASPFYPRVESDTRAPTMNDLPAASLTATAIGLPRHRTTAFVGVAAVLLGALAAMIGWRLTSSAPAESVSATSSPPPPSSPSPSSSPSAFTSPPASATSLAAQPGTDAGKGAAERGPAPAPAAHPKPQPTASSTGGLRPNPYGP
jgi:eukaryotic-like serine/threonine-protein kinase